MTSDEGRTPTTSPCHEADKLADLIEARIETYGVARVLVEIEDVHGVDLGALWEGFQFDRLHSKQIDRCAIVGDLAWERWLAHALGLFFHKAEIRFFEHGERSAALDWAKEET